MSRGAATWVVPALVIGLFLLLTAPAVVFWYSQSRELSEAKAARAEDRAVVDAATRQTMAWASVDHRDPDEYIETVEENATGDFLKEFEESQDALRQLLRTNKSIQVPTIPEGGAGLIERDAQADVATVLIAMDASVTNKSTRTPQPRQYRLKVTLQEVDGEWLTSGLEFIDAQT